MFVKCFCGFSYQHSPNKSKEISLGGGEGEEEGRGKERKIPFFLLSLTCSSSPRPLRSQKSDNLSFALKTLHNMGTLMLQASHRARVFGKSQFVMHSSGLLPPWYLEDQFTPVLLLRDNIFDFCFFWKMEDVSVEKH